MSETVTVFLHETTQAEALVDLMRGASTRLSSAAWKAQKACERITHSDGDALAEISAAEDALAEARRHENALRRHRRAAATP